MAASFNKVFLMGRLTRDPEARSFANGGKVVNFGFAVNERKKNRDTGKWEETPVFVDCEAFNRGEHGHTADLVEQYLQKGSQAFIEGRLRLDEWTDSTGYKKSKLKIVVDNVQFLDSRQDAPPAGRPASSEPPAEDNEPVPF